MTLTEALSVYAVENAPLLLIGNSDGSQWQCHHITQLQKSFKKLRPKAKRSGGSFFGWGLRPSFCHANLYANVFLFVVTIRHQYNNLLYGFEKLFYK